MYACTSTQVCSIPTVYVPTMVKFILHINAEDIPVSFDGRSARIEHVHDWVIMQQDDTGNFRWPWIFPDTIVVTNVCTDDPEQLQLHTLRRVTGSLSRACQSKSTLLMYTSWRKHYPSRLRSTVARMWFKRKTGLWRNVLNSDTIR